MLNCGALAFISANTSRGVADPGSESAVTRQAQREMEEAMKRQQEMAPQGDAVQGVDLLQEETVTPSEGDTTGN